MLGFGLRGNSRKRFNFSARPNRWTLSSISQRYSQINVDAPVLVSEVFTKGDVDTYPRTPCHHHGVQLAAHNATLFLGIPSAITDSNYSDSSSEPQPSDTKYLPKAIPFVAGFILMSVAIVFLIYCFNREDYFMYIGAFGGAIPFIFGAILVLFCLLPDFPPIFGFAIGSWHGAP